MTDSRSPRMGRAIDAARAAVGSPEQVDLLRARLAPQLGAAGGGMAAGAPAVLPGKVWIAVVGFAVAGTFWIGGRGEPQPTAARVVQQPAADAVVAAEPVIASAAADEPPAVVSPLEVPAAVTPKPRVRPSARRVPQPSAADPVAAVGPASEVELISKAQALVSHQPKAALDALAQHGALFPNGLLSEEREILWIDAEWALDRREPALALARRFVERYPHSSQTRRLQQLLSEHADDHKNGRDGTRTE